MLRATATLVMRRQMTGPTSSSITETVMWRFCWVTAPTQSIQAVAHSAMMISLVQAVGALSA